MTSTVPTWCGPRRLALPVSYAVTCAATKLHNMRMDRFTHCDRPLGFLILCDFFFISAMCSRPERNGIVVALVANGLLTCLTTRLETRKKTLYTRIINWGAAQRGGKNANKNTAPHNQWISNDKPHDVDDNTTISIRLVITSTAAALETVYNVRPIETASRILNRMSGRCNGSSTQDCRCNGSSTRLGTKAHSRFSATDPWTLNRIPQILSNPFNHCSKT